MMGKCDDILYVHGAPKRLPVPPLNMELCVPASPSSHLVVIALATEGALLMSCGLVDDGHAGVTAHRGHAGGQDGPSVGPGVVAFYRGEIRRAVVTTDNVEKRVNSSYTYRKKGLKN